MAPICKTTSDDRDGPAPSEATAAVPATTTTDNSRQYQHNTRAVMYMMRLLVHPANGSPFLAPFLLFIIESLVKNHYQTAAVHEQTQWNNLKLSAAFLCAFVCQKPLLLIRMFKKCMSYRQSVLSLSFFPVLFDRVNKRQQTKNLAGSGL